jgi:hypothetical protein
LLLPPGPATQPVQVSDIADAIIRIFMVASSSGDRRSAALNYEANISSRFSDTWIGQVKAVIRLSLP